MNELLECHCREHHADLRVKAESHQNSLHVKVVDADGQDRCGGYFYLRDGDNIFKVIDKYINWLRKHEVMTHIPPGPPVSTLCAVPIAGTAG